MESTYFEFEFIKKLNSENKTSNLLISPIGIEIILSLCLNGAEKYNTKGNDRITKASNSRGNK